MKKIILIIGWVGIIIASGCSEANLNSNYTGDSSRSSSSVNNNLVYGIIAVLVIVLVFLALREFNCWYWKINERIKLQKEQNELLQELINNKTQDTTEKNVKS